MIDLYLSKNSQRNQLLLDFFQKYGIEVSCHSVSEITKDKLIEMILKNPELTIRLPLAVSNKRVYPNLNLEEARALLPRDTKQLIYMAQTHYLSN